MKVKVLITYDTRETMLHIVTSHNEKWDIITQHPEMHLSSIIGESFVELFKGKRLRSKRNEFKINLTIEDI